MEHILFSLDNVEGSFRFHVSAGPIVTEEFGVVAVAAPNVVLCQN